MYTVKVQCVDFKEGLVFHETGQGRFAFVPVKKFWYKMATSLCKHPCIYFLKYK